MKALHERSRVDSAYFESVVGVCQLLDHAWRPSYNVSFADRALQGMASFTYVTYPRNYERGFFIAFVNAEGVVEHHPFTLLSPIHGIWRNWGSQRIGTLQQVLSMMMGGQKGQPL